MKRLLSILFIFTITIGIYQIGYAEDTFIVVHVRAQDAKFIGTSMGGAIIIIRNAETGEILDKGITRGETGDTKLIMRTPYKRGMRLTNDNTAEFRSVIHISVPTLLTIEAHAPGIKDEPVISTTQIWAIPGKHLLGDGIILTIPGFFVKTELPQVRQSYKLGEQQNIPLKAKIVMMCGCPITPKGLWDATKYEVKAIIRKDNQELKTVNMNYAGQTSTFSGVMNLSEPGSYEVFIYAYDPKSGNTGVDKTVFEVTP